MLELNPSLTFALAAVAVRLQRSLAFGFSSQVFSVCLPLATPRRFLKRHVVLHFLLAFRTFSALVRHSSAGWAPLCPGIVAFEAQLVVVFSATAQQGVCTGYMHCGEYNIISLNKERNIIFILVKLHESEANILITN